jgi:hypothetical protein
MKKLILSCLLVTILFNSCIDELKEDENALSKIIVGKWKLEKIKVEGADCQTIFDPTTPSEYIADEKGCAQPKEIQGNAKRCINVQLDEGGTGKFLWSEISNNLDAPITYTITNGIFEYCFEGSVCSSEYVLVGDKLEGKVELRLEEDCRAVYVLTKL